MNCCFHKEQEAVTKCSICGRDMCEYCGNFFNEPICMHCLSSDKSQYRKNIIIDVIIALLGTVLGLTMYFGFLQGLFYMSLSIPVVLISMGLLPAIRMVFFRKKEVVDSNGFIIFTPVAYLASGIIGLLLRIILTAFIALFATVIIFIKIIISLVKYFKFSKKVSESIYHFMKGYEEYIKDIKRETISCDVNSLQQQNNDGIESVAAE